MVLMVIASLANKNTNEKNPGCVCVACVDDESVVPPSWHKPQCVCWGLEKDIFFVIYKNTLSICVYTLYCIYLEIINK